jgi:LPXTG-motif cell wall-anchored protein
VRHLTGILAVILLTACSTLAQTTPSPGATTPTPGSLRILSPKNGDKVAQDFVDLAFELAAPASADNSPTFQLRLDTSEPVRTTDTRYTFTGLKPGRHTVSVEVVDANNTPVQGSRAEVHFTVAAAAPQSAPPVERRPSTAKLIVASQSSAQPQAHLQQAAFQESPSPAEDQRPVEDQGKSGELPQSGSALPLLALIGASGLIGGLLSVRRTRRR